MTFSIDFWDQCACFLIFLAGDKRVWNWKQVDLVPRVKSATNGDHDLEQFFFTSLDLSGLTCKMEKVILFTLKGMIEDQMEYLGNFIATSVMWQFGLTYSSLYQWGKDPKKKPPLCIFPRPGSFRHNCDVFQHISQPVCWRLLWLLRNIVLRRQCIYDAVLKFSLSWKQIQSLELVLDPMTFIHTSP